MRRMLPLIALLAGCESQLEARARMMAADPPPGMRFPQPQMENPLGYALTPRLPIQTNCMRFGNIISCSSY